MLESTGALAAAADELAGACAAGEEVAVEELAAALVAGNCGTGRNGRA